ncbi:polyribonucleotide nucleotidyltransferase 1, mitochondrial [Microplitis mediator]|uniref:polyribonucleotide nucleotidyltransferase 1, mitochondrial n=1 Tax=Microplitis mediator TaxID=375433 RepID=UPI0025534156|nr:polyribonucleotide nucleotidyltransferase 1, mitochondrial [Microplitis mediator]
MAHLVNLRLILNNKIKLLRNHGRCRRKIQVRYLGNDWSTAKVDVSLGNGKQMVISTGKLAKMANGCAMVSAGKTSVMITSVSKTQPSSSTIVPLIVDYRQKASATGRIPTNFLRRELGSTENEITAGRLIDRTVRPGFPKGYCYDTQLISNTWTIDGENLPDVLAINAASASLALSDIPWKGPMAAVRVGFADNEILINPTTRELEQSSLNLIVSAADQSLLVMMDGYANRILEADLKKAIEVGVRECQEIIRAIKSLAEAHGKPKKTFEEGLKIEENLLDSIRSLAEIKLRDIFTDYKHDKVSRDNAVNNLRNNVMETMKKSVDDLNLPAVAEAFNIITREIFRELIFENNVRCDGRKLNELRDIKCEAGLFELLHGSALFQRGQTQVACSVTLDSLDSALKMDMVSKLTSGVKDKNFFLHYEFHPYAVNEIGRAGIVGRREMGHGALAERGLRAVIPENYPFTIRLTSEVLESNGSSSMATVCGGSLALLDAGVPISESAAGVAIGLVTKYDDNDTIKDYRILTDLLGIEDYMGDMDFKIAGTKTGITAIQADIKVSGLPLEIVMKCISDAITAKKKIIDIMNETLSAPRVDKANMPMTDVIEVPAHLRGQFLGIGGANLEKIYLKTGVNIQTQENNMYLVFAPNETAMKEAKEMIDALLKEEKTPNLEFGGIYTAKVKEVRDNGVMVTLYENMKPTLLHNTQLDQRLVVHPSALGIEVGQEIKVKYFGRDPVSGVMRLSRKVLQTTSLKPKNFF